MVHPLALLGAILFQLVGFIRYHHVSVICQQFLFKTPCRFIIHDYHLQAFLRELIKLLLFLSHRAL